MVRGAWFISTTGRHDPLTLAEGETRFLALDPTIRVAFRADAAGGVVALNGGFETRDGSGLTVYREGRRIPLAYVVTDEAGETLTRGVMGYG